MVFLSILFANLSIFPQIPFFVCSSFFSFCNTLFKTADFSENNTGSHICL